MPEQDRVASQTVGEDGHRQRFHQGDHPHILPRDLDEVEEQTLKLHRATIHAPEARPRFGVDEDGEPIEVGPQGLVVTDPLTGAVEPLTEESLKTSEENHKKRAEQAESRYAAGAAGATAPPLPTAKVSGSRFQVSGDEEQRTTSPETRNPKPETRPKG